MMMMMMIILIDLKVFPNVCYIYYLFLHYMSKATFSQ